MVTTTEDFIQLDRTLREMMRKIEELFLKEKEITVNISHELMTPVSVLRSKLENMLLQENIDPVMEAGIEESLRTLHRLKTLVNSLLMIARIESRQYLREETVDIGSLLNEVADELRPIAEDAGVTISLNCDSSFTYSHANRSLLFSMFYNVVNNAVKNTPYGGSIEIGGEETEEKIRVSVCDTGRGMTKEQLDKLFSRFSTRLDPAGDSTGIGLAITKSIADFHDIAVRVLSEPGKGTQFFFFLSEIHYSFIFTGLFLICYLIINQKYLGNEKGNYSRRNSTSDKCWRHGADLRTYPEPDQEQEAAQD